MITTEVFTDVVPPNSVVLVKDNGKTIGRATMENGYISALQGLGVKRVDKHVLPHDFHVYPSEKKRIQDVFGGDIVIGKER